MLYTIKAVSPTVKDWTGQYGAMKTYRIKLDETGEDVVEVNRKPESAAPTKGEKLTGTIETTEFGKKFKAERKAFAGGRIDHHEDIKAQWAIGQAVAALSVNAKATKVSPVEVEMLAQVFYGMVDNVKSGTAQDKPDKDLDMTEDDFDIGDEPIDVTQIPF